MSSLLVLNTKGKYHDDEARKTVIEYITQPAKAIHRYMGASEHTTIPTAAEDMAAVAKHFNKDSGVRLRHFVLAFHPKELSNPETADEIGREIIDFLGLEYLAVYAVHENEDHLHIHIVINAVSHITGHRYRGAKKELYNFIFILKIMLKKYNIRKVIYAS